MRLFKHAFACLRTALAALALGTLALAAQAGTTDIYYHNDLAGTPMAATDAAGNVLWRQGYKPYGERLEPKAPAEQLPWYTGKAHVEAAGLSYFGARWYDPALGRFMGVDPVGFSEANVHSFNRYAYANNNPYKFVDPDGKQAVPALVPPGRLIAAPPPALAGRPSEQQQARQLEGFGAGSSMPSFSIPSLGISDVVNFALGGIPGLMQGLGTILNSSPEINPKDIAGQSPSQIDSRARELGLIPKGPDPKSGRGAYVDPVTGEQRVLCHSNCGAPHAHVNDPSGRRLDINGNRVAPESPAAHLPIRLD